MSVSPSGSPSSTNAMSWSGRSSPSFISAASGSNCRNPQSTWRCLKFLPLPAAGRGRRAMASNIKSKPSSKESPTEPFKRAVAGCLRALARKPELEVSFAAERPGLVGGKVRLPEPPRKLSKAEAAIVRGNADSIALRIACHDPAVHRRLQPAGQQARAVFEAVEQARVEAIGARRMDGVALNLAAMLDERFVRGKFADITDRTDAPIEDALALMVRERLTGLAPPQAAKKLVDLWRSLIEDRAGKN